MSAEISEPGEFQGVRKSSLGWRFAAVGVLLVLDLWSKGFMFEWLGRSSETPLPAGAEVWFNGHWRVPVIGDFLGWMISENKGAAWGLGDSVPWLLVSGRVLAVLVLAWLLARTPTRDRVLGAAYALVLAGAAGNLWDNLFRERVDGHPFGQVRDFIHVYFERWEYHFPTFNVADSCITVGAVLLILSGLRSEVKQPTGAEPSSATTA